MSDTISQPSRQSNILDAIHHELDRRVWDDAEGPAPKLMRHHSMWLQRIIKETLEEGGYQGTEKWLSLVFTGSLTTYQYSDESDVDISLFVDHHKFPDWSRAEMIGLMVDKIDGTTMPGTPHPVQCFVVPPEVSRKELYQPGLRSGYELSTDEWIVPPERDRVHDVKVEEYGAYVHALQCADKMERLLKYEPDKAIMYWHQIHDRRRRDQKAGKGDYAHSNIVYKMLSNQGLFPAIAEISGEYIAKTAQTQDHSNGFGYCPMDEEPLDQPLRPQAFRTATPLPKSKIPIGKMTPEQVAEYKAAQEYSRNESLDWLRDNPRSADNVVSHWDQTTPEHRDQGMSWYKDACHAAKQIALDRGITVNQAAGLIANYSPQQHWATNLEMASRAGAGERIGGPKQPGQRGFMASNRQAEVAARIMGGEDYHDIFGGKKIISFGHLIEHGQDTEINDPKVVVDRHALGVAHGGYADDGVYTHSKVSGGIRKDGSSPVYDDVANMYRQAADVINNNGGYNGVMIQPHQLQAATWLTRQRLNAEGGYSNNSTAVARRTRKAAESSVNNWNVYAAESHPTLVGKTPGTGFSINTGAGGLGRVVDRQAKVAKYDEYPEGTGHDDYYYHISPTQQRASIQTHGLQPANPAIHPQWQNNQEARDAVKGQASGVYAFDSYQGAKMYTWNFDDGEGTHGHDIWRIPKSEVKSVVSDPEVPNAFMIDHAVNPEMHVPWEYGEALQGSLTNQEIKARDYPRYYRQKEYDEKSLVKSLDPRELESYGIGKPTAAKVAAHDHQYGPHHEEDPNWRFGKVANAEIQVKTYTYRGTGKHPVTQHGRSFPWIYTPDTQTLHVGAVDSYHNDLVINAPELTERFHGKGNRAQDSATNEAFGRMSIPPDKVMMFTSKITPALKQELIQRVGGKGEDEPEDGGFAFG